MAHTANPPPYPGGLASFPSQSMRDVPDKVAMGQFSLRVLRFFPRQQCYNNAPYTFVHPSYSQVAMSFNNTHSTQHSLFCEARQDLSQSFMELEGSSPCSHKPPTDPLL